MHLRSMTHDHSISHHQQKDGSAQTLSCALPCWSVAGYHGRPLTMLIAALSRQPSLARGEQHLQPLQLRKDWVVQNGWGRSLILMRDLEADVATTRRTTINRHTDCKQARKNFRVASKDCHAHGIFPNGVSGKFNETTMSI